MDLYGTLVLDLETTFTMVSKYGKDTALTDFGSPFNDTNSVVLVGVKDLHTGAYTSYDMRKSSSKELLQAKLDCAKVLVGHNIKYDMLWLKQIGMSVEHLELRDTMLREYIILCGRHREDGEGLGLNEVAPKYGGTPKPDIMKDMWSKGVNTDKIPMFILASYLYGDVDNTAKVYIGQLSSPELKAQSKYHKFYHDVLRAVVDMEFNGAKYNDALKQEVEQELDRQLHEAAAALIKVVNKYGKGHPSVDSQSFNLNSSDQLAELVWSMRLRRGPNGKVDKDCAAEWAAFVKYFKPWADGAQRQLDYKISQCFEMLPYGVHLKPDVSWLSTKKWYGAKGISAGSKVSEAALASGRVTQKQKELLNALQAYSKAETWKSSNFAGVINGVRSDGYIHGSFNMHITATRRFSSSDPNMQNWPREGTNPLKKLVKSRYEKGYIVNRDYGQLEFRVAGILSGDELLIADVASGFDIHSHTAHIAFPGQWVINTDGRELDLEQKASNKKLRQKAKTKTFEFQYGAFPKNKVDKAIYDAFYGKYKMLSAWQERVEAEVASRQKYVCPFTGVIFDFPGATFANRGSWSTKAKNYPVQFLADAINKCAILGIWRKTKSKENIKLIATVHDSNVVDADSDSLDEAVTITKEAMEGASKIFHEYFGKTLDVPLDTDVSYGCNWYEQQEYIK